MRMNPSAITTSGEVSDAERRVFRMLEATDLGSSAVCFHSLNLSEHRYKMSGELDFVVLMPDALIVLEVKGGGVSRDAEGIWHYRDRFGNDHRNSEGPFRQAESGMWSLVDRLHEHLGDRFPRRYPFGWAVVLPDVDFRVLSVEWPEEVLIDSAGLSARTHLKSWLQSVVEYWRDKRRNPQHLAGSELDSIVKVLRPDFDRVPSLAHRGELADAEFERLTQDQYEYLDAVAANPRILCFGGAGSGKTFLAVEAARREQAAGRSVALLTSGDLLLDHLRGLLARDGIPVWSNAQVGTGEVSEVDVLVVDEAQDVLNLESLAALDSVLKGGLETGRWRFFLDVNHQTGLLGAYDPDALELLAERSVHIELKHNCRNTKNIVMQTQLLTGADLGVAMAGEGPAVEFGYYNSADEERELLTTHIRAMLRDGVDPNDITVLSPSPFRDSCVADMKPIDGATVRQVRPGEKPATSDIRFARIADFKGLENRFVALVDFDGWCPEEDLNTLYVAMSRAGTGLWVVAHENVRETFEAEAAKHIEEVVA